SGGAPPSGNAPGPPTRDARRSYTPDPAPRKGQLAGGSLARGEPAPVDPADGSRLWLGDGESRAALLTERRARDPIIATYLGCHGARAGSSSWCEPMACWWSR